MNILLVFAGMCYCKQKQHTKIKRRTIEQHLKGAGGLIDNTGGSSKYMDIHSFYPQTQFKQAECVWLPVGSAHFLFLSIRCGKIRAVITVLQLSWGT